MRHTHDDLRFAARVAATPLPPQEHPEFDTLLRAQAQAEIARREVRELALVHLYDFATLVLGYGDFFEPLHRPLCEHTELPEETLTLLPRGVFKSTVSSVAYPLWLLIKFPDTRVLLCNSGLTNPRKWIAEMKTHLTTNAVLRWMFPESCPAYEDVQQFGFTEGGRSQGGRSQAFFVAPCDKDGDAARSSVAARTAPARGAEASAAFLPAFTERQAATEVSSPGAVSRGGAKNA